MTEKNDTEQPTRQTATTHQQIEGSNNIQVAGENASVKITKNHLSIGFDTFITAFLISILFFWLLVPYLESYDANFLSQICSSIFCLFIPIAVILDVYSLFRQKWLNVILGTLFLLLAIGKILSY